MSAEATRHRILDAAERLFSEHGYGEVSLRRIIGAARVNVAAVHYHFGSKTELFQAILTRRIVPLNSERLALLDRVEAGAGGKPAPVERILECLMAPTLRLSRDPQRGGPAFMRLLGRTLMDPDEQLQGLLLRQFQEVAQRFQAALARSLPGLPVEDLACRMHFCIGAMAHTLLHSQHLPPLGARGYLTQNSGRLLERLVAFAAAGLQAPGRSRTAPRRKGGRL
jgi:AcrR family transcriptional regulator